MRTLVLTGICAAAVYAMGGCASTSDPAPIMTACEEPRPEICTQDYVPVCGQLDDLRQVTYSNACSACSVAVVEGYVEGACN
jgi:hypothetical protein